MITAVRAVKNCPSKMIMRDTPMSCIVPISFCVGQRFFGELGSGGAHLTRMPLLIAIPLRGANNAEL